MEDLTVDELKQLVAFYRNRSVELETQLLALQLKLSRPPVVESPVEDKLSNKKTKE